VILVVGMGAVYVPVLTGKSTSTCIASKIKRRIDNDGMIQELKMNSGNNEYKYW